MDRQVDGPIKHQLPALQWPASVAVFQDNPIGSSPCQNRSINPRELVIESAPNGHSSSGGPTVSRVRPAAANNQPQWLTGSLNMLNHSNVQCVCVCVCSFELFIHKWSDAQWLLLLLFILIWGAVTQCLLGRRLPGVTSNWQPCWRGNGGDEREECQRVLLSDLLPFYNTLPSIDVQKRNVGLLSERLFPFFSPPPCCDAVEGRWSVLDPRPKLLNGWSAVYVCESLRLIIFCFDAPVRVSFSPFVFTAEMFDWQLADVDDYDPSSIVS